MRFDNSKKNYLELMKSSFKTSKKRFSSRKMEKISKKILKNSQTFYSIYQHALNTLQVCMEKYEWTSVGVS